MTCAVPGCNNTRLLGSSVFCYIHCTDKWEYITHLHLRAEEMRQEIATLTGHVNKLQAEVAELLQRPAG